MKSIKLLTLIALFLSVSALMVSCGDAPAETKSVPTTKEVAPKKTTEEDHSGHDHSGHDHSGHDHSGHNHATAHGEGAAYSAAYVCPMHCEGSGSDKAGTCPACKMEYVAQADHTKDGHTH